VLAQEALLLGLDLPPGLTRRNRRALRHLQREGYVLKIQASRSLTFRVVRASPDGSGDDTAPFVDIWLCWNLADKQHEKAENNDDEASEPPEVALMSQQYGPKIPRSAVFPRRKLPFGDLVIWGPADPIEVTRRYLVHGGWSEDFMSVCEGRKEHRSDGHDVEYMEKVPCESLGSFAEPWKLLPRGPEVDEVLEAVQSLVKDRLPGLVPSQVGEFGVQRASMGSDMHPRLRAEGWLRIADNQSLWCGALLWRGDRASDDLLEPGFRLGSGQVVRSLTCGAPSAEPVYVWEDTWS